MRMDVAPGTDISRFRETACFGTSEQWLRHYAVCLGIWQLAGSGCECLGRGIEGSHRARLHFQRIAKIHKFIYFLTFPLVEVAPQSVHCVVYYISPGGKRYEF